LKLIDHGIFNLLIEDDIATMDFNPLGDRYPQELINDVFDREIKFLRKVKKYRWAPEILHINLENRCISFKWYNNTCEQIIPEDYKTQLKEITKDLHKDELIKLNFYKNYFYTDDNGILHTYAFYSTSTYNEQPINIDFYGPILNEDRKTLVDQLTSTGFLDMRELQKHAFKNYIDWPENPLPKIYEEVHE